MGVKRSRLGRVVPKPVEPAGERPATASAEASADYPGVRPVASSPLARIAAATRRARGGASSHPQVESQQDKATGSERSESIEATTLELRSGLNTATSNTPSSQRAVSRIPTPADLRRAGTHLLPSIPANTRGARLYASSASEEAPVPGLDKNTRLKLLTALQGMGASDEEDTRPKVAEPAKPPRPTPALFGKVQGSVAENVAAVDSAEAAVDSSHLAVSRAEPDTEPEAHELEAGDGASRIHPQQVREMHENFAEQSRPIVLIGPMAAGKTYIGTHLARFYGYEFLDADQLIVERYGEVSEIFEIFGEAHFRELERKTIEEVLTSPAYRNTVFSLGGGAPMTDSVAELLRGECVVYILVDSQTVTPRITGNKTRPLLQPNPVERWTDIFERRRSRYEELAQFTLDARGGRSITEMTAEIQTYVTSVRASARPSHRAKQTPSPQAESPRITNA